MMKSNSVPGELSKKPEFIAWSKSFEVGIELIDQQHKELLLLVNDLFSYATGNEAEERAYFKSVVHKMVQYVKTHFVTEEKCLLASKFPGYAEHKKIHDEFTLTIIKTVKDFEAGKRLVLEKLAYFLKDWILSHIAIEDAKYFQYFRKIEFVKAANQTFS